MVDGKAVEKFDSIKAVDEMSFEDYQRWLAEENQAVVEIPVTSDWELVEKSTLEGRAFVIARIKFNDGDYGGFTSVCCYLEPDGKKVVFNDGSTGIRNQLEKLVSESGRSTGFLCPKGLRASHYKYVDDKGVEKPATTYYIA